MGWPKYLKKKYNQKDLAKKVLGKLQLEHDKAFLKGLFVKEDGLWSLKKELSKDERIRLKKIVKEIKKGRGGVKLVPLIVLLVVVAGATVFAIVFKNPLATTLIEDSLEAQFGATVNLEGLEISLIHSKVKLDSLEVTDRDNLGKNLFELGETEISLKGRALWQKKIVMESLTCTGVQWGADRDEPGELLEEKKSPQEKSSDQSSSKPTGESVQVSSEKERGQESDEQKGEESSLSNLTADFLDPATFVEQQYDSLETPPFAEEKTEEYKQKVDEQKQLIEDIRSGTSRAISDGEDFLSRDYDKYKNDPFKIPSLVEEAEDYASDVGQTQSKIEKELTIIGGIKDSLEEDLRDLDARRTADMEKVKSLIALPSGGVKELFANLVKSYIKEALGGNYDKAHKAWEFIDDYRKARKSPDEGEQRGRRGRVIPFEAEWPQVLVQQFNVSALDGEAFIDVWGGDFSSDPANWINPISLDLKLVSGARSLVGDGLIDRRSSSQDSSKGNLQFAGVPVSSTGLSMMGISQFSGSGSGTGTLSVERDGRWTMDTEVKVTSLTLERDNSLLADSISSVLEKDDWTMELLVKGEGSDFSLDLNWPLLDQVDDEVGAMLKEQAENYLDSVEEELKSKFASELKEIEAYKEQLEDWEDELNRYSARVDRKKDEVNDQVDEVKDEAEERANKAANDGAKAAEKAANDAAKQIKNLF